MPRSSSQQLERLGGGIEISIRPVGEQHKKRDIGMVAAERLRQDARMREMALRYDRRCGEVAHDCWRRDQRHLVQRFVSS
jgi:hypothetical protein